MMKFQKLWLISVLMSIFFLSSCNDDDIITNELGSSINKEGNQKISTFELPNDIAKLSCDITELKIELKALDGNPAYSFNAATQISPETIKVKMHIPNGQTIADGEYKLNCYDSDEIRLPIIYHIMFKEEMLYLIQGSSAVYKGLDGTGTETDPYIIADSNDFDWLLINLHDNDKENRGKGCYFKQTADFSVPSSSIDFDGRGYASEPFAGIYNGNGFTISGINYIGARSTSTDVNIGLFDELLDGAVIKNLNLEVTIDGVYNNCGAIAGCSSGTVVLDSISLTGSISGQNNCGGLIGHVSGNLTVKTLYTDLVIKGDDSTGSAIGGAIGYVDSGSNVSISGMTTELATSAIPRFMLSGYEKSGGVIGSFNGASFSISDITLSHTISSSDSDIKIIGGNGNNIGGIIGHIASATSASYIKSVKMICPISGHKFVGGLIGYAKVSAPLTIEDCRISALIKGDEAVGGFFGEITTASSGQFIVSGENSIKVVDGIAVSVSGRESIGGLFGSSRCVDWTMPSGSSILIATNVTASEVNCGGIVGYMNGTTADVSKITLNPSLQVNGKTNTGGLVGHAIGSTITGRNRFNFNEGSGIVIPQYSRFTPDFSSAIKGGATTGGAVGLATETNIRYISVNTNIGVKEGDTFNDVGGIVGIADFNSSDKQIEDCTYNGTIYGNNSVGGIAGTIKDVGQLRDCINYGIINGNDHVGGIIGYADYYSISKTCTNVYYCVNTNNVNGTSQVGGIIGCLSGRSDNELTLYVEVKRCGNYGAVTGNNNGVGGIVGKCPSKRGRIYNCANHGNITSTGDCRTGGIIGSMGADPSGVYESANLEIGYCGNYGNVHSDKESHVGGILGYQEEGGSDYKDHDSWVHDCYNRGDISSDYSSSNVGGIVGCVDHYSYISRAANFGKTVFSIVGDRKTGAIIFDDYIYYSQGYTHSGLWIDESKISNISDQSEYEGFDFSNTWIMSGGYPILRDCPFQNISINW